MKGLNIVVRVPSPVLADAAKRFTKRASLTAPWLNFPGAASPRATADGLRSGLKNEINVSGTTEETGVLHGNRKRWRDGTSEAEKRNGKRGTHYYERCGKRRAMSKSVA